MRTCGAGPSRATGRRRHERFLLGDVRVGKRRKASRTREAFRENLRRRPTLPPRHQGSTIGAEGLSFRVRNGAGRFPFAMAAETLWRCQPGPDRISGTAQWTRSKSFTQYKIEKCGQVLGLLVPVGYKRYRSSTSGLSTQSSTGGLTRLTLWETSS